MLLKSMQAFVRVYFLLTLSTSAYGQTAEVSYGMNSNENLEWLATAKHADIGSTVKLVKERLIEKRARLHQTERSDVPLLIIDGIPFADDIDERQKAFLITHVTARAVDIQIITKEPEGLYINKAFTGIVLIVFKDKKLSRKFQKL